MGDIRSSGGGVGEVRPKGSIGRWATEEDGVGSPGGNPLAGLRRTFGHGIRKIAQRLGDIRSLGSGEGNGRPKGSVGRSANPGRGPPVGGDRQCLIPGAVGNGDGPRLIPGGESVDRVPSNVAQGGGKVAQRLRKRGEIGSPGSREGFHRTLGEFEWGSACRRQGQRPLPVGGGLIGRGAGEKEGSAEGIRRRRENSGGKTPAGADTNGAAFTRVRRRLSPEMIILSCVFFSKRA